MQVVILAGGRGTRLVSVAGNIPKPLVDVCGVPLLGRQLELVADNGIRNVVVLTGHGGEEIAKYCGDGSRWKLELRCVRESSPRGTAGAVLDASEFLEPQFIVMYGDTVLDVDLTRFVESHRAAGASATLFLHPNDHPQDSDLVEIGADGRVRAFHPYPHPVNAMLPNLVNAALYVLETRPLVELDGLPASPDFGKHVFPRMLELGYQLYGYKSPEYVKDAGTPTRIEQVRRDIEAGRVAGRSLRVPAAAVFIDRDGVLNEERGRITRPDDLALIEGAAAGLMRLNESGMRTVIVTNQPVMARGDCTELELGKIHARLDTLLGRQHSYVDALYLCPHHPDKGFPGEVANLKFACDCRKPNIGLFERAKRDLNIDPARSWMIGDMTADIEFARRAGLRSVLVLTGHGGRDGMYPARPDFIAADFASAVALILDDWPLLMRRAEALVAGLEPGSLVLVGGAAGAGKTTLASALALTLRARGMSVQVIGLDDWLRSVDDRGEGVLGRFNMEGAEEAIVRVLGYHGPVPAPRYDPVTRTSQPAATTMQSAPGEIVIVEGTPVLLSERLVALAARRIHLEVEEVVRKARFVERYAGRGADSQAILSLYEQRNIDEVPAIRRAAKRADIVVGGLG